jgi:hypothetical protein
MTEGTITICGAQRARIQGSRCNEPVRPLPLCWRAETAVLPHKDGAMSDGLRMIKYAGLTDYV